MQGSIRCCRDAITELKEAAGRPHEATMKLNFKAALLSGFVLPGLGQLRSGRKVKGAILLSLVNLFFLCTLFTVLRAAGKIFAASADPAEIDPAALLERVRSENPMGKWLIAGFVVLWAYGFFDALLHRPTEGKDGTDHRQTI
jgi:hypothetical protein